MIAHLIAALLALPFHLSPDVARRHVEAAHAAALKYHFPTTLLLGMALVESNFNPAALSRVECVAGKCKRVMTPWIGDDQPPNSAPSWFCGPLQSGGQVSWDECRKMRDDVAYGYLVGAKELTIWLNVPACRGLDPDERLQCALAGYNGGFAGVAEYTTRSYPTWVRDATEWIKKLSTTSKRPQS